MSLPIPLVPQLPVPGDQPYGSNNGSGSIYPNGNSHPERRFSQTNFMNSRDRLARTRSASRISRSSSVVSINSQGHQTHLNPHFSTPASSPIPAPDTLGNLSEFLYGDRLIKRNVVDKIKASESEYKRKNEVIPENGDTTKIYASTVDKTKDETTEDKDKTNNENDNTTRTSISSELRYLKTIHEQFSITDTEDQENNLKSFQNSIIETRKNLEPLTTYLTNFQKELSKLSNEMETLQERSKTINSKLEKRKKLEKNLNQFIEPLIIPPKVVLGIVNGEINSQWINHLKVIKIKRDYYKSLREQQKINEDKNKNTNENENENDTSHNMVSLHEMEKVLHILILKAVERIRDFIVLKIRHLRVNGVNSQSIQQELLHVKEIYSFIYELHPKLAIKLRQAYINTIRWYYLNGFQRYARNLEKLKLHNVDRNVLICADESATVGFLSSYTQSTKEKLNIGEYLALGKRIGIIDAEDPTVMLSQIAKNNPATFWIETSFRSFNLALVDNGTVEYQFIDEFFVFNSNEERGKVFEEIFTPSFKVGEQHTKNLIAETFDSFGILICIRISQKLQFELQHRRIPILDDYFNLQLITLWPRFQVIIDANCDSIRRASTKSSFYGSNDSVAPHQMTQHFASFVSGLLKLSNNDLDTKQSEPLSASLTRLQNDFESALTKLSTVIGSAHDKKKSNVNAFKREQFLYNNYFLVTTILSENEGEYAEEQIKHFKTLTEAFEGQI